MDITAPPTRVKYKGVTPPRERPILFSGTMVRAILAGAKTQTRRPVKMHADGSSYDRCRYGAPGERLWVRETWQTPWFGATQMFQPSPEAAALYSVPGGSVRVVHAADWTGPRARLWRSPYHMPRWASRLTLEVTGVRVERLQDICEEDARAEGAGWDDEDWWRGTPGRQYPCVACSGAGPGIPELCHPLAKGPPYRCDFGRLWDAINGKRAAWATNPWVWVIAFRRLP
jgi:hypothetical protein